MYQIRQKIISVHPFTIHLVRPTQTRSCHFGHYKKAIQLYTEPDPELQPDQSHANFPGGVNFRSYRVKYISGNVKIHKDSTVEYDVYNGVNVVFDEIRHSF